MRKLIVGVVFLLLAQGLAFGQTSDAPRAFGYIFGGVGGRSNGNSDVLVNVGGGGERLVYKGLGVGGEIGYLSTGQSVDNGFGLASANISYHFNRSQKLQPFVTGGGALGFQGFAIGGGNVGAGVQYWMRKRVGLRFEVRDFIFSSDSPHTFVFRVGLSFR